MVLTLMVLKWQVQGKTRWGLELICGRFGVDISWVQSW